MSAAVQTAPEPEARPLTLVELVREYLALLAEVDAADGEVDATIDAAMTQLAATVEQKVDGYAAVYRALGEQAASNRKLAGLYTERAERLELRREQIKARLSEGMRALGLSRVKAATATAWFQKPSTPKLVVKDEAAAMQAGFLFAPAVVLDKPRLRSKLEDGNTYDFAELVSEETLRIKY